MKTPGRLPMAWEWATLIFRISTPFESLSVFDCFDFAPCLYHENIDLLTFSMFSYLVLPSCIASFLFHLEDKMQKGGTNMNEVFLKGRLFRLQWLNTQHRSPHCGVPTA